MKTNQSILEKLDDEDWNLPSIIRKVMKPIKK